MLGFESLIIFSHCSQRLLVCSQPSLMGNRASAAEPMLSHSDASKKCVDFSKVDFASHFHPFLVSQGGMSLIDRRCLEATHLTRIEQKSKNLIIGFLESKLASAPAVLDMQLQLPSKGGSQGLHRLCLASRILLFPAALCNYISLFTVSFLWECSSHPFSNFKRSLSVSLSFFSDDFLST